MKNNFIYPCSQLVLLLHPKVLKVYIYLLGWQTVKTYKLHQNHLSKMTRLTNKDIEISIQTLVDNKLINIKNNNGFEVEFNREEAMKYFNIPIDEIPKMDMLPVSKEITWNKKTNDFSIEDMNEEQIKTLLIRLQASLNEKKQLKKIVSTQTESDDLPF